MTMGRVGVEAGQRELEVRGKFEGCELVAMVVR